jgi:REP element-mobilizing transposase RayT
MTALDVSRPTGDPGRRHPIHQPVYLAGNRSVVIFVTVNTHQRKSILGRAEAVEVLVRAWKAADAWLVGRYVVMPDHVHLFCAPRDLTVELRRWVRFWKSLASRWWPWVEDQPIWQLDFWDTQLRRGESYAAKWDYVWRNPQRRGLVTEPSAWPYAGELNVLAWHEA